MAEETVFICYRRDDSGETAGRIFDRLRNELTAGTVFRDLDSIPLGVDFREHVRAKLAVARVVLVLIGPDWLAITDGRGRRRLDNAADHVRVEVELALHAKNVRVIPVLCRHAEMPSEDDLPESIRGLAFQNGDRARPDPDFHRDVDRLRDQIKRILAEVPKKPEPKPEAAAPKPAAAIPAVVPVTAPAPATNPAVPAKAAPKTESDGKKNFGTLIGVALFLAFWAAVIYGAWTGGRYVIGKVSDYFHKPTPPPNFPPWNPTTPRPVGTDTIDWKDFKPGGSQSKLLTLPTPTPTPTPPTGRAIDPLFPNNLKIPGPHERLGKFFEGQPPAAPSPNNR